MNQASGVAATPYQGYGGEETAPINAQQQAGFGNINQAQGFFEGQEQPLSAADIQRYQDPYTNQVIDATQRDFDVQNERGLSQTKGNAASIGALGGDREAVAAALTKEGQTRVQAPVIAGLRSAGYQSAVNTAAGQQDKMLRAGVAAQQGAQAQVGAGTLEQQTQQAMDTQNRLDYYQQQGYPFQVAQWLAQMTTGVGSQLGGYGTNTGTSTTQGPTPNPWSQVAGVGLAAAGMFAADGGRIGGVHQFADGGGLRLSPEEMEAFLAWKSHNAPNDSGQDYDLPGAFRSGIGRDDAGHMSDRFKMPNHPTFSDQSEYAVGDERNRAGHWARGGGDEFFVPPANRAHGGYAGGGSPYGAEQTWVPTVSGITAGRGAPGAPSLPSAPSAPQQKGMSADQMKGIGAVGKKAFGGYDNWMNTGDKDVSLADLGSATSPLPGLDAYDYEGGGFGGNEMFAARGGRIRSLAVGGVGASRPAYADDEDGILPGGEPFRMLDRPTEGAEPPALTGWRSGVDRDAGVGQTATSTSLPPEVISGRSRAAPEPSEEPEDASSEPMGYASTPRPQRGVGAPAGPEDGPPDAGFLSRMGVKMTPELKQGLLQAGLAMMATRHGGPGSFLQSAGEAGMTGVGAYTATQQNALEQQNKERKEAFEREKFDRPYSEMTAAQRATDRRAKEAADRERIPSGYRTGKDGSLEYIKGGPEDPERIKEKEGAKKSSEGGLSDAGVEVAARQAAMGDQSWAKNIGRGAQSAKDVTKVRNRLSDILINEQGKSPVEAAKFVAEASRSWAASQIAANAGARTRATREENLSMIIEVADSAVPAALETSAKLARGQWVPINKIIQKGQVIASNPELAEFGIANLQLAEGWARAMNPTGVMRESDREKALEFLGTATSHETYERAVKQIQKQIHRERDAISRGNSPKENAKTDSGDSPSPKAIELLNSEPTKYRDDFEKRYGKGSAERFLGK